MSPPETVLKVQINQIDYTLAPPGSLDNSTLPRVPVIRIYGPSSVGPKTCVHVHQVYPYFFVEYPGAVDPDSVKRYIARMSRSLNYAIAISKKRDPNSPSSHYVRAIVLTKGVHFYGFHSTYSPFLKIYIADPALTRRAVTIMRSGTVMRTQFRIFESHLNFILQFMSDFGLYGCGWIELADIWERGIEGEDQFRPVRGHSITGFDESTAFKPSPYFRQSRMLLEIDTVAPQILNRNLITARNIHHKLEIPAPPLPTEPLVLSVRELWEDERNRRRAQGLSPSPELPVDPSERSRSAGGDWVAEARWWDELRARIERERDGDAAAQNAGNSWERWVMTAFQSVEALWDSKWKVWKPVERQNREDTPGAQEDSVNPFVTAGNSSQWTHPSGAFEDAIDVDVDEARLSSQEIHQLEETDGADCDDLQEDATGLDYHNSDCHEDDDHLNSEEEPVLDPQQSDDAESTSDAYRQIEPIRFDTDHSVAQHARPVVGRSGSKGPIRLSVHLAIPSVASYTHPTVAWDPTPSSSYTTRNLSSVVGAHPVRVSSLLNEVIPQSLDATQAQAKPDSPVPSPTLPNCGPQFRNASPHSSHRSEMMDLDATPTPPVVLHLGGVSTKQARGIDLERSLKKRKVYFLADTITPTSTRRVALPTPSKTNPCSFRYALPPPGSLGLLTSMEHHCISPKLYRDPHYSRAMDAPERLREYAGLVYYLKGGDGLAVLEPWDCESGQTLHWCGFLDLRSISGWEFAGCPPSVRTAKIWLHSSASKLLAKENAPRKATQIEGPTQMNPYGLKNTPLMRSDCAIRQRQNMTILSFEIFAFSRSNRVPDAELDEICAAFYSFKDPDKDQSSIFTCEAGQVIVQTAQVDAIKWREPRTDMVATELDLINRVVDIICDIDPDILIGWEVQAASWGYLKARGQHYGFDIEDLISRAPSCSSKPTGRDQWGVRTTSSFQVVGRHVLNLWRIMRVEQTLNSYSFENVAFHVLRRRVPKYATSTLTRWYTSITPAHTARLVRYFVERTSMVLELLVETDVVTKTAEFARVFGVDFFSVISRGSQFKVESFMSRIAKPESFLLLSPSKQDVGKQNAAECMPLIMEPLSAFYSSPLLVLDFQSLYPSVMIAYNYCYSTCLGRVVDFKGQNKFGVTELSQQPGLLKTLQDHITIAPNGIMYVKKDVRRGLLGRMLAELLETRVMVKQAMKRVQGDKALTRILDARQLGLKFIANVTYGYTGATYSGRMPAVEIGDSIVQTGRETLEKAIRVIEASPKWKAKVVYGDTDSIFVYLRGRTKEQAFLIGHEIADTITAANPAPIKLKFEKVYLPCVLMAKKRYVGFKFEKPDDEEPVFDAKGIETVRRDGIPAQQKMMETCLKILFRTQDLSKVKEYCCSSWRKILDNTVSIQDFIFAKEVKMGTYSDRVPPPPGVTIAARRMLEDENDEPQYGERIPYLIARGEPDVRLVERAVAPEDFLHNRQLHIDSTYYILRVLIPPLERIFNLVGADVRSWYDEMPKAFKVDQADVMPASPLKQGDNGRGPNRFKIEGHFRSSQCFVCGSLAWDGICDSCRCNPQETVTGLLGQMQAGEQALLNAQRICASCTATAPTEPIECISIDCPWVFEKNRVENRLDFLAAVQDRIQEIDSDSQMLSPEQS